MDSERDIASILRKNFLPIILGLLGFILLLFGIVQVLLRSSQSTPVTFEPAAESTTPNEEILVDIEGAVMKPGVYRLKSTARIVDALAAAGGMSEEADRQFIEKNINLAKRATDGLKIYIPRNGEQILSDSSSSSANGPVININTASASELDTLAGVGAVTVGKIIDARPYADIGELVSKKIVGQATYEKIKDKISAN